MRIYASDFGRRVFTVFVRFPTTGYVLGTVCRSRTDAEKYVRRLKGPGRKVWIEEEILSPFEPAVTGGE